MITHIDDRLETRRSTPAARRLSKSLTAAAVALIAGLALSGCTSSSAPAATPPASSTSTSSTTSSVSTSASPTPTGISSSVSSSATLPSTTAKSTAPTTNKSAPSPPTTKPASPPPASPVPWPATLTRPQIIEAKSALAAFTAYYVVFGEAFAHPGKDWSASFAKVASDPEKSSTLRYLKATAKLGQYGSGHIRLISRVTKVQTAAVELTVCVDTSNVGFFDKTGRSIKAPDAPGSYYRHPAKVGVYEFVGNQWLVTTINNDFSKTC